MNCTEIQKLLTDSIDNKDIQDHISNCGECSKFLEDLRILRNYAGRIEKTPVPDYLGAKVTAEFREIFTGEPVSQKRKFFSDIPKPVKISAFLSFLILFGIMIIGLLVLQNGTAETVLTIGKVIVWQNILTAFFIPLILKKFRRTVQLINGETLCQIPQVKY